MIPSFVFLTSAQSRGIIGNADGRATKENEGTAEVEGDAGNVPARQALARDALQ